MVKMPILLAGHTMNPAGIIRPLTMQQQWRVDSLSTASMELDDESPEVTVGDWIQVFAPNGMSGVFYVKSVRQDKVTKHNTVTLEHTMGLLADMVVFGEKTARDMGGTGSTVPVGTAITYLLNQQTETLWTLYQNDFQNVAQGWKFTNSQILADLNDIADAIQDCQWEFDQSVFPWRLSLKAWPTDATMEMRMNRNIGSMKVSIDRSRMFTRCYPTGKNNKHIDSVNGGVSYLDRNTAIWGVVAQVITDNSIADPALLKAWAEKQLKKNAEPAVTISISGYELSKATGEPMDRIVPGRICRVPLPKYETTITERVTELNWKNVMLDEESVTVTLANEHKTIAGVLNEKAGGGGGGKKSNTEHDCELQENEVKIEEFENSDIWVNRESIWAVSGAYTVTTDSEGRHIRLKDGSLLEIKRNGIYETVGTARAIGEVGAEIDEITGSALWTQREAITAVSGKFTVNGDQINLVDGAELKIKKDGVYSTVGTVTEINGVSGRVSTIEGSALWTQRNSITEVSGKFTVNGDQINLVDGAELRIKKDGVYSTVGTVTEINGVSGRVSTIEGSALWTQRNSITAVTGLLEKDASGNLVVKDGAGLYITRSGAKLGVYDSGNLSAGVIVDKINGGTVKINAAHIELNGDAVAQSLASKDLYAGYLETQDGIATEGSIYAFGNIGTDGGLYSNGEEMKLADASVSGNTLTIKKVDGSTITFNKAGTPTLSGSWSGGILTVTSTPTPLNDLQYYLGHGETTWNGRTGTVHITSAPSSSQQGTEVYNFTVTAPFTKQNDDQGRGQFYAYYYNRNGQLESMGSRYWYYQS